MSEPFKSLSISLRLMNNQTSVSSTFVHLSSRIISYLPISFLFNLSIPLIVSALILFFFHHIPLFLSSPLLIFVFILSAWSCITTATVITYNRPLYYLKHKVFWTSKILPREHTSTAFKQTLEKRVTRKKKEIQENSILMDPWM